MFFIVTGNQILEHHFDYLGYDANGPRVEKTLSGQVKEAFNNFTERRKSKFAIEVMTKNVISIKRNDDVKKCFELMIKHEIRHLPVVEETSEKIKKITGFISYKDVLPIVSRPFSEKIYVSEIMSKIVVCAAEDTPVNYLAHVMINEKISAMSVISKEGQLLGIVSYVDLLKSYINR